MSRNRQKRRSKIACCQCTSLFAALGVLVALFSASFLYLSEPNTDVVLLGLQSLRQEHHELHRKVEAAFDDKDATFDPKVIGGQSYWCFSP